MKLETRLSRLASAVGPTKAARDRVFARVSEGIGAPAVLRAAALEVSPDRDAHARVWQDIARVVTQSPVAFFDRVRAALIPPVQLSRDMWQSYILPRLAPQVAVQRSYRSIAWVTAVAVVAVSVRISPALFFAPASRAASIVTLLPTRGEVFVSVAGLWQPIEAELALVPGMQLKTGDGEASILLRDDGVVRMASDTEVILQDLTERLEPAPEIVPTLSILSGRIWVQGLIPAPLRGITVALAEGSVTVHEGSVSITRGDLLSVDVYNRSAVVLREGNETRLAAGDRMQAWSGSVPLIRRIAASAFADAWVSQNLSRDAVHRKDVAALQQERRVARAGILPTSPLYTVKRAAEAVDVMLTFDGRTRVEKQIAYAGVRLDEAAALLQEGETDAVQKPLAEYKQALVALAGTSTDDTEAHFLLQQAVSVDSAQTAAAAVGEGEYLLKQTVLEALAALPGEGGVERVQSAMLLDGLSTLAAAAESGDTEHMAAAWTALEPHLALLDALDSGLDAQSVAESKALLGRFAVAVADQKADFAPAIREAALALLPKQPVVVLPHLTDEQVLAVVSAITDRVFVYRMPRSRRNQLLTELKELQGNPDAGRILRALYHAMPEQSELVTPVRRSMVQLNKEIIAGAQ
ncbi:hypothetical protein FJZ27_01620 [Candidatus Peribacteria bacterium]|nr:hypothetical protein [Candidatus Peribacteria bacterium]